MKLQDYIHNAENQPYIACSNPTVMMKKFAKSNHIFVNTEIKVQFSGPGLLICLEIVV